jgi:hypothetical protein
MVHNQIINILHIHDELKQQALQSGVMVLQRSGDIMETSLPI